MTGETHRAGGLLCTVVGFVLLRNSNLLLPDVNEFVQLAVMYPFAKWGSVASDLDHHWDSCPEKDPPSWIVNRVLHITSPVVKTMETTVPEGLLKHSMGYKVAKFFNASHRSWQTHSDLTLACMVWLLWAVLSHRIGAGFTAIDTAILALILSGLCIGIIAHFILDMLTPQGVWFTGGVLVNRLLSTVKHKEIRVLPEKWHFVPKMKCFATGSAWESFVCKLLKIATVVSVVYLIFWVAFPSIGASIVDKFPWQITFV